MFSRLACVWALTLASTTLANTTGWHTGEVYFMAYVDTAEHQEIYPICAGQITLEVSVYEVYSDPAGALENSTSVKLCYDNPYGDLSKGDAIEVTGVYYGGACPLPLCNRVQASYIQKIEEELDDDDDDDDDIFLDPIVVSGGAEPTETTVTFRATLVSDGGLPTRCRFLLQKFGEEEYWHTDWLENQPQGSFSQTLTGLVPDTSYYYYVYAENDYGMDGGRRGIFKTLPEKIPPIPHPATWVKRPDQSDTTTMNMTGGIARDISGPVEYAFDFVASPTGGAGGSDSAWQYEPWYTDIGLNPNHQYEYRVRARDAHGSETAYSTTRSAYTAIDNPGSVSFGEITPTSIEAQSTKELPGLDRGQSGLRIENITVGQTSLWKQDNSFWTSEGLLPNREYTFRAQARNGDGDPTDFSADTVVYTRAVTPSPPNQTDITTNQLLNHWGANSNPLGTEYLCTNTVTGADSDWTITRQWLDTNLSPNTRYGYHVKARNGDGLETDLSLTIQRYSAIEAPTRIRIGTVTANSIQIRSENTPSRLSEGQSGLRFENISAGQMSNWQSHNNGWNSEGLLPNRRYSFRAQARNGDGKQSAYSEIAAATTHANIPSPAAVNVATTQNLLVQWGSNGNPPGTLYMCENTTAGSDSGWTPLTMWDSTGLKANTQYSFRLKAQNSGGVQTGTSQPTPKYTAIEAPTGISFGTITATSIAMSSENTPSGLNRGSSGLRFENVTTSAVSAWQGHNNPWQSGGLVPNTHYVFRAQARNGDADETPYGVSRGTYTRAQAPAPLPISNVMDTSLRIHWSANGNPFGTYYRCENTTTGADSGWTTSTSWDNTSLSPYTTYRYRVKARNANGIETAWTDLGEGTTGYRSLDIDSTDGGQVSAPGEDIFHYPPQTTVQIKAQAQAGFTFSHWSGSAVDAERVTDIEAAETSVLVDAHYSLKAHFLRDILYVDGRATGNQDGTSWENAFSSLQDALAIARRPQTIRIAQGQYTPDQGQGYTAGDITVSFVIPQGVTLLGGYAGIGGNSPAQRDTQTFETVLSGDLANNDRGVSNAWDLFDFYEVTRLDNSMHVIDILDTDESTRLEGLTISSGNGTDGAGIRMIRSSAILRQCTFSANRGGELSGTGLESWDGIGAAISCYLGAPLLEDCLFQYNWTGIAGGAVYSHRSDLTVRNCRFINNHAGLLGGALCIDGGTGIVVAAEFWDNWSWDGGAVCYEDESQGRLSHCRFYGNGARGSGGAVYLAGQDIAVTHCLFSSNLAYLRGGGLAQSTGFATLTHCTFGYNEAKQQNGGAAIFVDSAQAQLTNSILWDDIFVDPWQLIALTGTNEAEADLSVTYCIVKGGYDDIHREGATLVNWGTGNTDAGPRFVKADGTDGIYGTPDDDLRLARGSQGNDAGNNTSVPLDVDDLDQDGNTEERIPLDLAGRSRFTDDPSRPDTGTADSPDYSLIVDMGAYEYSP